MSVIKYILISMILNIVVFAKSEIKDNQYIDSLDITSEQYSQKIDLNLLQRVDPLKKEFIIEKPKIYNKKNWISFQFGVQREDFEEKNSYFVESITPSLTINFYSKIFKNIRFDLNNQISKNAIILKQNLKYDFIFFDGLIVFYPLLQIGEKIAIKEQINSGYFFINAGLGMEFLFKKIRSNIQGYYTISDNSNIGVYMDLLYRKTYTDIGIYFSVDYYNPQDMKYERQGQKTVSGGFIFKF